MSTGLPLTLQEKVVILTQRGSSLTMSWGEEGGWECDWISGGLRYRSVSPSLTCALDTFLAVLLKAGIPLPPTSSSAERMTACSPS